MNLANRLTVSRFFLSLGFVIGPEHSFAISLTAALCPFPAGRDSPITRTARSPGAGRWRSDFGRLMDPLVDKIMMAAAFICLVPLRAIPAWAATVIVSREFLITGLRLLAASKGHVLSAEKLGKHKTAWQIITAIFFLLMLSAREFARLDGFRFRGAAVPPGVALGRRVPPAGNGGADPGVRRGLSLEKPGVDRAKLAVTPYNDWRRAWRGAGLG